MKEMDIIDKFCLLLYLIYDLRIFINKLILFVFEIVKLIIEDKMMKFFWYENSKKFYGVVWLIY